MWWCGANGQVGGKAVAVYDYRLKMRRVPMSGAGRGVVVGGGSGKAEVEKGEVEEADDEGEES
jgi:hypothetical protein